MHEDSNISYEPVYRTPFFLICPSGNLKIENQVPTFPYWYLSNLSCLWFTAAWKAIWEIWSFRLICYDLLWLICFQLVISICHCRVLKYVCIKKKKRLYKFMAITNFIKTALQWNFMQQMILKHLPHFSPYHLFTDSVDNSHSNVQDWDARNCFLASSLRNFH